ncbi:FecR domain-containing protein [Olivibacter sp. SDN3]|uniref:FecR family protein n=1 Tax=Olivibacter sp. SDN3 TaxID=2764720 RepID=UPI001650D755|nr:FecR domain-containing protein [Olivibacter sp. SDN3]QNL49282.1 FecR domain-containing protein [Olivibacter sp. SDN3]
MMMATEERIRQLYIEKIAGVISEENERWLQEQLLQEEESRKLWQRLQIRGDRIDLEAFVMNIDVKKDLTSVKRKLRSNASGHKRKMGLTHAAAILLLFGVAAYIFQLFNTINDSKKQEENTKIAAFDGKKREVQLLVGEGEEEVDLENTRNTISVAGQTVKRENGELIYRDLANSLEKINTLVVPPTKDYKLTLADGTKVWLNSSSRLKFPMAFLAESREVYLEGEAYFEIASDVEKPFIVHTAESTIRVLGTKFNLSAYDQQAVTTALVEGKVQMETSGGAVVELIPGYKGVYDKNMLSKESFDASEVLSWKEGVCYFRNRSLLEIGNIIYRWFDLPVFFDNDNIKSKTITGLLEKQDLEGFLNDLEASLNIKYRLSEKGVYFY